jgi:DNA-binding IclR family transcriptional regulator
MTTRVTSDRQGIHSIEVGFRLLDVLARSGRPMMLRDIAAGAGMPAAKAHRYMVSFMRTGMIEQDSSSGRYLLGSYALEVGLSALGRLDPVRLAGHILENLCEEIQETVALAVWGNRGATIVRIVDSGAPITIMLRAGTVVPLCKSATGQAFAAFFRSPFLRQLLDEELREISQASKISITTARRQLEKSLAEVRRHGISRASGSLTPGINGFSAPVFDHSGMMVAAITSLGTVGEFSVEWDSPVAKAMVAAASELSRKLGFTRPEC